MIVIPMAGLSQRFIKNNYHKPKFMLDLHGKTLFNLSISSFKNYFHKDLFVFITLKRFNVTDFIERELLDLGLTNYKIILLDKNTRGQADTVFLGLDKIIKKKLIDTNEEMYIFNIDTFRHKFKKPLFSTKVDGYLEVFLGSGENWSYAKIDSPKTKQVIRTTEKIKISDYCSSGLYYFRRTGSFIESHLYAIDNNINYNNEIYISLLYNYLIDKGDKITIDLIEKSDITFCGTPDEYEFLKQKKNDFS